MVDMVDYEFYRTFQLYLYFQLCLYERMVKRCMASACRGTRERLNRSRVCGITDDSALPYSILYLNILLTCSIFMDINEKPPELYLQIILIRNWDRQ